MFLAFRLIRRLVAGSLGLVLLLACIPVGDVLVGSWRQDRTTADAIVVFGAAQFDGDPSPVLRNRLDHALRLYDLHLAPRIVTVGGKRVGDRFTEATAGRNYLHDKGVSWSRLSAVKTGDDTYTSARAVAAWAKREGVTSLLVVTDRAHMARAMAMLHAFSLDTRGSAPRSGPGSAMTWQYIGRESVGLLRFWLFKDANPIASTRDALAG